MEEQPLVQPTVPPTDNRPSPDDLNWLADRASRTRTEIAKVLVGQEMTVTLMLNGVLSGGHVLLEGVPGIAKTLAAKLLARTLSVGFSRLQFTPDLMPSDVLGTSVFSAKTGEFSFHEGPVFSNVILIDEINRSPAKTQAALFEVMEERQATVDGKTYPMSFPFFVVATQNPIEQEGTYRLPEAQLDRFLFRIKMEYPTQEQEVGILQRFKTDFRQTQVENVQPVFVAEEIRRCQEIVERIHIKDELLDYIAKIIVDTRNNGDIFLGASPRASLAIMKTSKTMAALAGRDFVTPDDIRDVSYPVLNHRIILNPEREMEGFRPEDIIKQVIEKIAVPR
jgi:MoxR-like ATPase